LDGESSVPGNRFRITAVLGTPAIGTIFGGEVTSGSIRRRMVVRLQSAKDGTIRPGPIDVVAINQHQKMKGILYKGQNVEALEEVTPASGQVGIKVKGVHWTEARPGDVLLG
jgi:translation elongation factor EF-1alpha